MSTRWLLTFKAIDPNNLAGVWNVGIPEWLYRTHQKQGNEARLGRIILVQEVLEGGTLQLRQGWSRPDKEDGCYVYIGKPDRDFRSFQIETPPPPEQSFLVFVLQDGSIDEWTWRRLSEEKGEEDNPDGVKGNLIWSQSKS